MIKDIFQVFCIVGRLLLLPLYKKLKVKVKFDSIPAFFGDNPIIFISIKNRGGKVITISDIILKIDGVEICKMVGNPFYENSNPCLLQPSSFPYKISSENTIVFHIEISVFKKLFNINRNCELQFEIKDVFNKKWHSNKLLLIKD